MFNFGIFSSGISSKFNIRNLWYNQKHFLPLYFCRSSRYRIVKWPLIVNKIVEFWKFFELDTFQIRDKKFCVSWWKLCDKKSGRSIRYKDCILPTSSLIIKKIKNQKFKIFGLICVQTLTLGIFSFSKKIVQ